MKFEATVILRMTPEMKAELEAAAVAADRPVAWLIRDAVAQYLAAKEVKNAVA